MATNIIYPALQSVLKRSPQLLKSFDKGVAHQQITSKPTAQQITAMQNLPLADNFSGLFGYPFPLSFPRNYPLQDFTGTPKILNNATMWQSGLDTFGMTSKKMNLKQNRALAEVAVPAAREYQAQLRNTTGAYLPFDVRKIHLQPSSDISRFALGAHSVPENGVWLKPSVISLAHGPRPTDIDAGALKTLLHEIGGHGLGGNMTVRPVFTQGAFPTLPQKTTRPFANFARGNGYGGGVNELAAESNAFHILQNLTQSPGITQSPVLRSTVSDALKIMQQQAPNHSYIQPSINNSAKTIRDAISDENVAHVLGQLSYLDDFTYAAGKAPHGATKMTLDGVPVAKEYNHYFDDFLQKAVAAAKQRNGW
jgi:hypothetical protein